MSSLSSLNSINLYYTDKSHTFLTIIAIDDTRTKYANIYMSNYKNVTAMRMQFCLLPLDMLLPLPMNPNHLPLSGKNWQRHEK